MAPDKLSLAGKVAIVTGSGRENGIGAAIAFALARNGANVAINYVSSSSASRIAKVASAITELGARVVVVQADVSTPEGAAALVDNTLKEFQTEKIDILVNNVGTGAGQGTLLVDLNATQIQTAFCLNTFSTLYMAQATVPYMPRGGRIANIGSVVSRMTSLPGMSIYGASKAAQEYLTGAMALELGASHGITVNTVAPGPTAGTDANGWFPNGELKNEVAAKLAASAKLERGVGNLDDVADVVLLVVSEQGRWMTGQYIAASGGITE
ncbi:hypothetical protein B0H67DRAFT_601104 [Lasiosphaeris hirsuta]|uniref:Uncharacterized protein n=1 Tax=Lasiosphaeris hirsuta TaxID=260670 RepID=A0AA40AGT5_9PEZI|nr:hypothetical protein B0H67DRAFT_601104 [Lasiosphaeris hirsuta]